MSLSRTSGATPGGAPSTRRHSPSWTLSSTRGIRSERVREEELRNSRFFSTFKNAETLLKTFL